MMQLVVLCQFKTHNIANVTHVLKLLIGISNVNFNFTKQLHCWDFKFEILCINIEKLQYKEVPVSNQSPRCRLPLF